MYICDFSRSVGAGKRYDPKDARTDPRRHGLDDAALAGSVAALEDDADLPALVAYPLLQLDQFDVQLAQLGLVVLAFELPVARLLEHLPASLLLLLLLLLLLVVFFLLLLATLLVSHVCLPSFTLTCRQDRSNVMPFSARRILACAFP